MQSFDRHIPWVTSLARRLSRKARDPSIGVEDLIQEGLIAVHEAINQGKDTNGYLKIRAWGAMLTAIGKTDFVSSYERSRIRKVRKFVSDFIEEHGREPSGVELEEVFGSKIESILVNDVVTATFAGTDALNLASGVEDKEVDFSDLYNAVQSLSTLQRGIVELRFFESLSWNQVQERVCISSRGTIFYHYKLALEKLKEILCEQY